MNRISLGAPLARAVFLLALAVIVAGCGRGSSTPAANKPQKLGAVALATALQKESVQILGREGQDYVGGTGIVLNAKKGLILTNDHVISGTSTLHAWNDHNSVPAQVIGDAPCDDLAVVKMQSPIPGLKNATFVKSDQNLKAGAHVTALGYPASVSGKVVPRKPVISDGEVSSPGTERSTPDPGYTHYDSIIATSTPISPGYSGGPLVNDFNQVVAVNTLGSGQDQQNNNYSISADQVHALVKRLENGSKIAYVGWDLLPTQEINDNDRSALGWQWREKPLGSGLAIKGVDSGSPADRSKFAFGDYIYAINGTNVNTVSQVCDIISSNENNQVKVQGQYLQNNTPAFWHQTLTPK